jgi:alginate O-acetyltransferase complex protein AlgI
VIFNSVTYLLFLSLVACLFWVLPQRARLWMIFVASMTFYGFWRPEFLLVLLLSAASDFFVAQCVEGSEDERVRQRWLLLSLLVNLGLLLYFKYLFFFIDHAVATMHLLGYKDIQAPALNIVLPLGISFYTFQTISYTVDVYRKFIRAEKDFVLYGCFVAFFPQLVAGPILRGRELLHQLFERPQFRLETFVSGLRRILIGLFLKVVLADNIAPLVDFGFDQPVANLSAIDVMTLAFLFGFQIYFDFAAYSHIAIGSARLMGISFPENFNFPYMASSPREFWRRWHISLSSWIRDYLYLPLLGVKVQDRSVDGLAVAAQHYSKNIRHPLLALFLTWAIMGFWHGANWTFVVWGLFHALCVMIYRVIEVPASALPLVIRVIGGWLLTLTLMMLAWIPFRAQSVSIALEMYGKLFSVQEWFYLGMRENTYLAAAFLLVSMAIIYRMHEYVGRWSVGYRWLSLLGEAVVMGMIVVLVFVFLRPINQFIYFQF